MSEDSRRPPAPQGLADFDELQPFLILRRNDGSFSVAARAENGIISLAPLVSVPDPPKRKLFQCPCCDRWIVLSEWPNGVMRLYPLPKAPDDDTHFDDEQPS
jgi:hypothetical protein